MSSVFVPDPLFLFDLKEGIGAVPTEDILYIIPDVSSPSTKSVLYTIATGPITILGKSEELIAEWQVAVGMEVEE